MPQIDQIAETFSSQLFWLAVFFGITYFLIGRGMVPKIMGTVEMRDKQISDDLAAAQAARDAANSQEEAWRERENENRAAAQALIAQAKAKASASTEAKLAEAQDGLDHRLEQAEARIAEARNSAMSEIESVAAEATREIVEKLVGNRVDDAAANAAVKEAMAHG